MSIFLLLMIAGLTGLALMALPGLGRHGHGGVGHHSLGHVGHATVHLGHAGSHAAGAHVSGAESTTDSTGGGLVRGSASLFSLLPSPRAIFSMMTLFGAFGYALVEAVHLSPIAAGLLAMIPAVVVERLAVTPLWNLLFRFEGTPSAPLDQLAMSEATAVTPFHNGRGVVSVVHDGRAIQLRAELAESQKAMPVRVGDTLCVEEVDAPNERITVSVR
jgi:hypothetical protein